MTDPINLKKSIPLKPRLAIKADNVPVRVELLQPGKTLPIIVSPLIDGANPRVWLASQRDELTKHLLKSGAVLLRGFENNTVDEFRAFVEDAFGPLLDYKERSSPRQQVGQKVYTSTEYPKEESIFFHNENSYQHIFPLKIAFFCVTPSPIGGETPIVDVRRVYQRIPEQIRHRFESKKVLYQRNFSEKLGLPWQQVFQTTNLKEVAKYCADSNITIEVQTEGGVRTRQVRPAVWKHPVTGEPVWFNHAAFFHASSLPGKIRDLLLEEFSEDELPSNSYYGDGTAIEPEVVQCLREAYQSEAIQFKWQKGDILLLDNMLVAHARAPFEGNRQIVVAMAQAMSGTQLCN